MVTAAPLLAMHAVPPADRGGLQQPPRSSSDDSAFEFRLCDMVNRSLSAPGLSIEVGKNRGASTMQHDLAGSSSVIPFRRQAGRKHDGSDEVLVREIGAGSKPAMRTLFARHQKPVYRFLCRMLG